MVRPHGPHLCYCPNCNTEVEVEAYVKCNTQICPNCGTRMRAKETGEYRTSGNVPVITTKKGTPSTTINSIPCPVCHYPIREPTHVGEQVKCLYCGTVSEAILQEGVTIPTPVFVGIICFGLGVVLGPSLIASTQGGSEWLARKARERLA